MDIFDSNIDVNKYKVFLVVAELKSFSKTAEYMHISQPAISRAIKELEFQLNTQLFIRDKKNVILTDAGEKIKGYIKNAFETISLGEKVLKEEKDDLNGVIRIGIYSHISLFMLPEVIKEFNQKYPNAKFYIYSTSQQEMVSQLKNNELDLVIMQYPIFINEKNIQEDVICTLDTCFFSNKEYYDLYLNNAKSLTEFPIILPKRGFPDISRLEELLKKQNIVIKNNFTVYTMELITQLVKQGLGIGWGVKKSIEKELNDGELYELNIGFDMPVYIFSVAYRNNLVNNTTQEFINLFKERMKNVH